MKRNKILYGLITVLLIIAIGLNIHKLNDETYVKEVQLNTEVKTENKPKITKRFLSSDKNENVKLEDYNKKYNSTISKDFRNVIFDNSDNNTKLIIYYNNKDDIVNKIKFLLNDKNLDDLEVSDIEKIRVEIKKISDKEQDGINSIYNRIVFIFIKVILIILTIISFFIKNRIFDIFLFIMLIIVLGYSIFGLYKTYDNKASLILSIVVTILYFIIFILKVVLDKTINISYHKYYSNIYLYVLLFLISILFLFLLLRITKFFSNNTFILYNIMFNNFIIIYILLYKY